TATVLQHIESTRAPFRSACVNRSGASCFREKTCCRGRIRTKWSSVSDTDCRLDSLRLTSSRPGHTGVPARCTRDEADPADEPVAAPLSTELWHCTAYPGNPEATWAQPLSREELS